MLPITKREQDHSHRSISISTMFHTRNSSDLDMGRRPELKSKESFVWNMVLNEILRCEVKGIAHSHKSLSEL